MHEQPLVPSSNLTCVCFYKKYIQISQPHFRRHCKQSWFEVGTPLSIHVLALLPRDPAPHELQNLFLCFGWGPTKKRHITWTNKVARRGSPRVVVEVLRGTTMVPSIKVTTRGDREGKNRSWLKFWKWVHHALSRMVAFLTAWKVKSPMTPTKTIG